MSEPEISNLARRLAEQNNVDWRRLSGSGQNGAVVEHDVLVYLARVMAGEEAIDPTPEPLPDGMESWTEVGADSVGNYSRASGYLGNPEPEATPALEALDEAAARLTSDGNAASAGLSEDLFLLDDEDDFAAPASASSTVGGFAATHDEAPGAFSVADDADLLLVSDDDLFADEVHAPQQAVAEAEQVTGELNDLAISTDSWAGSDLRLDDEPLSAPVSASPNLWDATDAESPAEAGDVALFESETEASAAFFDEDTAEVGGWEPGGNASGYDRSAGAASHADVGASAHDELWLDATSPAAEQEAEFSARTSFEYELADVSAGDVDVDAHEEEEFLGEVAAVDGARDNALWEPGPAAVDAVAEPTVTAADYAEPEPAAFEPAAFEPTPVAEAAPVIAAADVDEQPAPVIAAGLPLVRTPNLLRRNVDVSALAAAQLAVGLELGKEEPLPVAPFLLRAVAKAARDVGVVGGQVALAELGGEIRLRRVDGAAVTAFVELVKELEGQGTEEDEVAIVAVDLSGLEVDEAFLDLAVPAVTFGRLLYDSEVGGYRSTLALTGGLPLDQGARLLARVAELIATPVRLLV